MVCLHNGGTSSTIWRDAASAFSRRREVFALDLPGFGVSTHPTNGLRLAELVDMVVAFVDEQNLGPVEWVGNCMGSAIGILLAERRPELVRSLVLFNPLSQATFRGGRLGLMDRLNRHAPGPLDLADAFVGRLAMPALLAEKVLRTHFGDAGTNAKLHTDAGLVACYTRPHQMSALRHVLSDMESFGAIDRFRPGPDSPPMCTIWGEQNIILSAAAGRVLNKTLKPSREAWLSDCGHLPMLEHPERCIEIMTEFFEAPSL